MAHTKSAKKRARQYLNQQARNRATKSTMKTQKKALLSALVKTDKAAVDAALREYNSILDKAVKRGVIKKNQAVRKKTRAAAAAVRGIAPTAPAV